MTFIAWIMNGKNQILTEHGDVAIFICVYG